MIRFLFSPYGRISRKSYWLDWILPYFLISIACLLFDYATFSVNPRTGEPPPVFQLILAVVLFWPSIAVTAKRLHDRGMTGWWQAVPFLATVVLAVASYWYWTKMNTGGGDPTINLAVVDPNVAAAIVIGLGAAFAWVLLYPALNVLFLRGQAGPNKYGDDPLGDAA